MPRYTIYVSILPHEQILDPAGKATLSGLHQLGFAAVADVRIGKRIRLQLDAADRATAVNRSKRISPLNGPMKNQ